MSQIRVAVLLAAVAAISSATAFSQGQTQGLITEKAMSMGMAQAIAQGAIEKCRADGMHIAVTVLDGGGQLKVFLRDDGASIQTVDVSHRKAYTALVMRRTSAEASKMWAGMSPVPTVDGTIPLPGGVPIKAGNEVIGAVGVSGARDDESCSNAGIAKVADQLK
jgi:uncharacterized protein GlcG (DUF336 family)